MLHIYLALSPDLPSIVYGFTYRRLWIYLLLSRIYLPSSRIYLHTIIFGPGELLVGGLFLESFLFGGSFGGGFFGSLCPYNSKILSCQRKLIEYLFEIGAIMLVIYCRIWCWNWVGFSDVGFYVPNKFIKVD